MADPVPFEDLGGEIETDLITERLVLDIDGFEGPIDLLLTLARDQKVDLTQISILQLAEQYLSFVERVRELDLDLAADYLVMASWLAYLKSRLLLPELDKQEEPTGEEMAAALSFQLRRLEMLRRNAANLMGRGRLGEAFLGRGEPEDFAPVAKSVFELTLYDLLKAYGEQHNRRGVHTLRINTPRLYEVEAAIARLRRALGHMPDWQNLWRFLPSNVKKGILSKSAVASTFAASLELVKEGKAKVRQTQAFGSIYVRGTDADPGEDA